MRVFAKASAAALAALLVLSVPTGSVQAAIQEQGSRLYSQGPLEGHRDVARKAPFQVQAWAFRRSRKEIYVRRIRIGELGNMANSITQDYGPSFTIQNLTLPAATQHRNYQVTVTWSDGSRFSNWYELSAGSGRTVMVQSPL